MFVRIGQCNAILKVINWRIIRGFFNTSKTRLNRNGLPLNFQVPLAALSQQAVDPRTQQQKDGT